ncbi:MAG: twin-arginine translocase TatA/TatE family subunit [Kiritimatiellae bacterium]|nr:twin-arginine translocase TatA/TatE family subunit [Kiritimatiellia bacterium]MDW8458285.1 twin-arginine translocase TatA/TatE family subunit [Verrucomicrobiota bacterium]
MMLPLAQFVQNIGMTQLLLILIVLILLFGSKKIPDLARALGKSIGEFKKGREEGAKPEEAQKSRSSSDDASRSA